MKFLLWVINTGAGREKTARGGQREGSAEEQRSRVRTGIRCLAQGHFSREMQLGSCRPTVGLLAHYSTPLLPKELEQII